MRLQITSGTGTGPFIDAPTFPKINGSINTAEANAGSVSMPTSRQLGLDFTDQSYLVYTHVNEGLSTQITPTANFGVC